MADYRTSKKPKKVRYHFSLVFFVAVAIFAVMFFRYMKNTGLEQVLSEDRNIVVPAFANGFENKGSGKADGSDSSEVKEKGDITNPVPESETETKDYFDSCVFIGDSITYGMSSYGVVPASSVLASMSMSVAKVETELVETRFGSMTALDAIKSDPPANIYIMLGSNGMAFMSINEMYLDYSSFVTKVMAACPDSCIYLISVPPVTADKETTKDSPIKNSDINQFNEKLLELANDKQIHYLDLNSYLSDESGSLPASDAENDGLHFKYSTYEKLTDYVLSHTAK